MPWTKSFDPQTALRKAVDVFWTKGYDGTSMNDLLHAMGIQKGSFYDTFGSKHEIYLQAMDQYSKIALSHSIKSPSENLRKRRSWR